jgi:hypothetical protein
MKILFALLLLFSLPGFAKTLSFDCDYGSGDLVKLTLSTHSAEMNGIKLINMMPVDKTLPYRGYALINDPWYDLDVETSMLKGREGVAIFSSHNTSGEPNYKSATYSCVLSK